MSCAAWFGSRQRGLTDPSGAQRELSAQLQALLDVFTG
jgi:hypothetical protein